MKLSGRPEPQFYRKSACSCVFFFNIKTRVMTTLDDFTMCHTGTGRCCKKVCVALSLVHISFSKNLVCPAYAEFNQILYSFEYC